MPYILRWSPGFISLTFTGQVTGRDVRNVLIEIWSDKRYSNDLHQLWDCEGVDTFDIGWKDMQAIRDMIRQLCRKRVEGRVAIVTRSNLIYSSALALVAMTREDGRQRRVFRDLDIARSWLNLAPMPPIYFEVFEKTQAERRAANDRLPK